MSTQLSLLSGPILLCIAMLGFWISTVTVKRSLLAPATTTEMTTTFETNDHIKLLKKMDDETFEEATLKAEKNRKKRKIK
ncbi:hypothetical protein [Brevibacillus daliensis]|uniref:hypothetical protein n=1 Tax=Brevibacillus daliensis TaxID=2892995 RepID=UPI001E5D261A|nr:hypothetical protein [Brevibacillus daliensis]